jgi:signal transduction histidine kinase
MKKQKKNIEVPKLSPAKERNLHFRLEDFRTLAHRIFNYANSGVLRDEFMRESSKILLDFSGCDSIELWVMEHNKYYRCKIEKGNEKLSQFGAMPILKGQTDRRMVPALTSFNIDHLSHNIITAQPYVPSSYFTKYGAFWTGETKGPIQLSFGANKEPQTFNLSDNHYNSLAIIPITVANKIIGLLQLRSQQPNYFIEEGINFYEGIAQILGDALVTRHAQIALRERVKELSCLYGIALLTENPNISLNEILQGVTDLLPPAMLYPDKACAQIIFDKNYFSTLNFKNAQDRLTADIIIDGMKRGKIEVGYTEKEVELDEGPFLKEERDLIDTVASDVVLIVERRKIAEDKERLQSQLRHADRLATIGQLAAGVAHELNEPLGNILGFAQLAKKAEDLPEQSEKDIDNIIKASLHAREVIKKLMFFARQMPPKKVQVNLNQLVEDGLYFLKARCDKGGIEIVRTLTPDLPEITADPSQLYQVFVNLVVNAIQAMSRGGTLTIRTFAGDDHITLAVEDTGVGMSEEVLKQIFIPFFTTKGVGEGTGLGLSVAHGIVTAHGGTIKVSSKVGQGSRFEVKLPLTGAPDVAEEE